MKIDAVLGNFGEVRSRPFYPGQRQIGGNAQNPATLLENQTHVDQLEARGLQDWFDDLDQALLEGVTRHQRNREIKKVAEGPPHRRCREASGDWVPLAQSESKVFPCR